MTLEDLKRPEETTVSEASIPKQIEQLAKLKEQEILSKAEFEPISSSFA